VPLDRYQTKRDFSKTPEPSGAAATGRGEPDRRPGPGRRGGRFVVQRHRATRLHYDFRLEIEGVLVSWAVPKGPTLDPRQRRMAVHVEDHPIEYLDFEGVIPARQYGAGDVIVWDWGTWTPDPETPDPPKAIDDGELKFSLAGEKLRGRYTIVRTSRRPGSSPSAAFEDDSDQWLLIKKRDETAVDGWDAEDHPQSVKTGRTNDEVKARKDAIWVSRAPASSAEIDLTGAREAPMPGYLEPMAASLASKPFRDDDWLYEVKWDGYRVEAVIRDGKVRLYTRRGNDAETYFPKLLTPPTWIDAEEAIVDGEVVALDEDGAPDFSLLQERITAYRSARDVPLVYEAFDLLYLDGRLLTGVPLEERKKLLKLVLRDHRRVRFASHVETEGLAFFEAARRQGIEGIVAKHRRSRYEPGRRATTWLKIKIRPEQELVVGGWTPGDGKASELGAVVVGVYEGKRLRFAGKVGSGFDARWRRDLRKRLDELETEAPPFDPPPPTDYRGRWGGDLVGVRWVRPELVIRAELGGWTREGIVRQTAFKGLELDRDPATVIRERAVDPVEADREAEAHGLADGGTGADVRSAGKGRPVPIAGGSDGPARAKGGRGTRRTSAVVNRASMQGGPSDPAWAPATESELSALATMEAEGTWEVGGQVLKLTNLDKVLFPPRDDVDEQPITKRELVGYFARIAPAMLPHLARRALNLHRYPNGAGSPGFWQKDIPPSAPNWLTIWHETGFREREEREANDHLIADRTPTLAWLGNQAAFEIHAWTSTIDEPWRPTFALIDIDPGTKTTWAETLVLARLYRTALDHLGVRAYPKLTGSRGIQAFIPIVHGKYTYDDTSRWVGTLSRAVGATVPDLVSWEWAKKERGGKARLDYTQNAAIKTLVAPYAVRPRPGAPVSAPISWEELDSPDLGPNRWTIRDEPERVASVGDLFAGAAGEGQDLPEL
jgi:bifunctional non-homologous end joining protein LigD